MRVEYVGIFASVHVPDLDDRVVARGVPVEVSDELGERLCQQSTWRPVGVPRRLRPRASRPVEDTTASDAGAAGEEV